MIPGYLDRLRAALDGGPYSCTILVGIGNLVLPENAAITTPWGELRAPRASDRDFILDQGVAAGCVLHGSRRLTRSPQTASVPAIEDLGELVDLTARVANACLRTDAGDVVAARERDVDLAVRAPIATGAHVDDEPTTERTGDHVLASIEQLILSRAAQQNPRAGE